MNHSVRFVRDAAGEPVEVIMPIGAYHALLEEIEDLESVLLFDEAMAARETPIPFEQAVEEIESQPIAEA